MSTTKKISELDAASALDGTERVPLVQSSSTVRATATAIANTASSVTLGNTGLKVYDTGGDHSLTLIPGEDLTADRTFQVVTGDANRTLTLSGNATLNQNVSTTGSPGFVAMTATGATGGIGYATGAGGTVTQATSRTTGVTLNTVSGAITLVSAAGSATPATFTVTNSAVAATDVIVLNQKSGTDLYHLLVTAVAAGSFNVTFFTTGGTTAEQPVINFAVIKGVAA